jgi:hypothetical protein
MSELITTRDARELLHRQLLATVSALALTVYVSSTNFARADDADRPTVWIELGGQMEMTQGTTGAFTAPFMFLGPKPEVYNGVSFIDAQRPARFAFGAEGKITFQPEDSDWKFSAGIRYGRSNATRHKHRQLAAEPVPYNFDINFSFYGNPYHYHYEGSKYFSSFALADAQTKISQSHVVLDFQAGKDVGLGLFGRNSSSTVNAGVRFASFVAHANGFLTARPEVDHQTITITALYGLVEAPIIRPTFHQYTMTIAASRSFRGIGPSLSWDASAALLGNKDAGELTLDWGVNAALLFGRQKAKIDHTTNAYHQLAEKYGVQYPLTGHTDVHTARSRSVVVPNLGGFAGVSVKYPNVQVSFGYRADFFFGAMDTGIDRRSTKNVGFHGPFATVSIGLGG